jgi:predicted DCC family thiol-disulfide oxidoreductase YuxK
VLTGPVLLYDGDCAFCRGWVARLSRWDHTRAIRCLPAAERRQVEGLPPISDEELNRAMHLVTPEGTTYVGAGAVARLMDYLPRLRWLGPVLRLPGIRWLSDKVYCAIARRRHRFGCGSERCRIGESR